MVTATAIREVPANVADENIPMRDYVNSRVEDLRNFTDSRVTDLRDFVASKFASHHQEHELENRALMITRDELLEWKKSHNEWQQTLKDANTNSVGREEYYRAHSELGKKLDANSKLTYVGIGIVLAVQFVIGLGVTVIALLVHK